MPIIKDLCRLCATQDEFSKDLLDESNRNVLNLIEDFLRIIICENDTLPTKICLNCEEKMVSLQLFILECNKTQEALSSMLMDLETSELDEKKDDILLTVTDVHIKSEVKDENADYTINTAVPDLLAYQKSEELCDYQSNDISCGDDDDEDAYSDDNITIASLKLLTKKELKKKIPTEEDTRNMKEILRKDNLKIKDLVKLECVFCEEQKMQTWSMLQYHYAKVHHCKPVVYCLCGLEIKSKSVLYKHLSDHKIESRKLRKAENGDSTESGKDSEQYPKQKVSDFVNFTCVDCHKKCSSWYSLKSHCIAAHKTLPVVKCVCGIVLKSKSIMYKHVNDHRNPNMFSCDKCPRITKTLSAMNKHKFKHIPKADRKYPCSSCEKTFKTKETLKSHERSHIPVQERKIFNCEVCNMKFTTRSSVVSHKRVVHDKIKAYVCDLCGYACGTNGELRQHRAIHSDDKPFVCDKCDKTFKTYSNLKTHMDIHEDTSYECFICRRVLNSRRTLRKHLLVHEDKCRHVCSYCNKAFKRRQTLKVHMYTHTGVKPLTCKLCDERFAYASTLRSHRMRCHPELMVPDGRAAYPAANYNHVPVSNNYIKNDMAPANPVAKNEVEAL
ncbi:zinc finger protein 660 [Bombyx mori]|uniref:Uncharacterized protein n=1 Tax=Bombyx mori TaxID=7091 RepID=A0A8R1WJW3_BOMMO|nr:zinc finger protein 660 [Bombyx mori]